MSIVLITAAFALVLAFVLGTALGFFREFFAVPEDPLISRIREALPGANCGACGFPGCDNYAAAIAAGKAGVTSCSVGGPSVAEKIAAITGISGGAVLQTVAVLACQGSSIHAPPRGKYTGLQTCWGAKLSTGSTKLCSWGCLGFGDCVKVCKFGALALNSEKGLPVVEYSKCTGCRLCVNECPQGLLKSIPGDQKGAMTLCSNLNPIRQMVAKTCKIACIKCGLCVKNCPQQCISLDSYIPVVDLTRCISCGTCVEKCPTRVFKIIERDIFKTAEVFSA
ncbi:MAG: RnfABCDGE type electron transport complex subunit B [Treponema sp.]|jgi:Na+-translocating ferredoxin:NAD+ oxidoreductase RNF subunit RnfB|nr:RnfABCDGE type electron transport complex subunit B [Treponema sp.]